MAEFVLERANYWAIIGLMMLGLYIVFESTNMIKRLTGLSVFQTSVFLLYITLGKVAGGTAPILYGEDLGYGKAHGVEDGKGDAHGAGGLESHSALGHDSLLPDALAAGGAPSGAALHNVYSNPLPHVLILTAIVVGVATLSVGLAITVRIREAYGTIEADDVRRIDIETSEAEDAADAEASVA